MPEAHPTNYDYEGAARRSPKIHLSDEDIEELASGDAPWNLNLFSEGHFEVCTGDCQERLNKARAALNS